MSLRAYFDQDSGHLDRVHALVTANARDFEALHAEYLESGKEHEGILIVLQQTRLSLGEFARRFARMDASLAQLGARNRLAYIQEYASA